MKHTEEIMLTESTVANAIEAIHTCGIPEIVMNQMGAHTSAVLRNALGNILNKGLDWCMLYNSGRTLEGTDLNTWRLITSEFIDSLVDVEPMFHAVYNREVVFFERQPRLEDKAGLRVTAYSHGDAGYNSDIVKCLTTATITICNTVEGVQDTFNISSKKLNDILAELVRRLQNEEMGKAYIVAAMPSTKEERREHGSRWTIMVLPGDALTAHGSSRVNRLYSWGVPKGSKVAVIGAAKKLEEQNPALAFQPEDLRVQFYYSWRAMKDDPDLGALVDNYRSTLPGPDTDSRAMVQQAEPFSVDMAAFHQQEFGTSHILYTEAALINYREHKIDKPIIRLHDLSGKGSYYWLRMHAFAGFELCGSYEGGVVIASTDDDAPLFMIYNAISKMASKVKKSGPTQVVKGYDGDESAEERMVKAILRAMATEVITDAAQTMSCTPLVNPDIMNEFIEYAYKAIYTHAYEIEREKRAERDKTITGRIRNMF